ncbi:SDR family oxidoreductase [Wenzhouxiangella sp. AB-CW3]|uniref:SDR family oxidoreductase n=1 Tax=Wenzhouxiangella sp. AB-CW3 TaxID=2771012 RepID=UPI00168B2232|nr:SDR family oxidoreductase [Wenzhouxiangella sp. AB-CW3]QOC21251.1 SDR family oxidoreductase [Wenzhouxiangella sp. AB-CW3]
MRTAVVTGANRGIGLELVRQLSDRGYRVVAVCRTSSPELNAAEAQVEEGVDITYSEGLADLADRLRGTRIDLLVNNAGVLVPSSLDTIEDELDDWRLQYEVNSLAPLRVTQTLRNHLNDGGRVVIISSRVGSIADNSSGGAYAYRMSKAAVNIAGVSLAHELADRNIAVGLLHPGYVRTGMTGNRGDIEPAEAAAGLLERIEELSMENTGSFRHANGETLPW